jgi:NADH-quinone oxidoreductase subunit H
MEQNFVYSLIGAELWGIPLDWMVPVALIVLPLVFLLVYALVAILAELKISAFIQERLGPMRTGPWGILQPIAEVVKLLQKEDITPDKADKTFFNLAPYLLFAAAFASFAVIPFSQYFIPADINLGLFFIFAVGSIAVIGLVMGGWASNNKYSLLGAMRAVAQLISYEIPAAMCLLAVAAMAGSLDLQEITKLQDNGFWNWFIFGGPGAGIKYLFLPFTFGLGLIYLIASLAETNRTPFDLPEGESEIVAGFHTEYSGMKFAMFFFAEYANMFVVSALIAILFFGGWSPPYPGYILEGMFGHTGIILEQVGWFVGKSFFFVLIQIWLRWTLPRFRMDQMMGLSWKILIPFSFVCFLALSFMSMLLVS